MSLERVECLKFYRASSVKPIDVDLICGLPELTRSGKLWMSDQVPAIAAPVWLYRSGEQVLVVEEH